MYIINFFLFALIYLNEKKRKTLKFRSWTSCLKQHALTIRWPCYNNTAKILLRKRSGTEKVHLCSDQPTNLRCTFCPRSLPLFNILVFNFLQNIDVGGELPGLTEYTKYFDFCFFSFFFIQNILKLYISFITKY